MTNKTRNAALIKEGTFPTTRSGRDATLPGEVRTLHTLPGLE